MHHQLAREIEHLSSRCHFSRSEMKWYELVLLSKVEDPVLLEYLVPFL